MPVSARRSTAYEANGAFDADGHYGSLELLPGERAGPPLPRGRSKALWRGVIIVATLGGGWALVDDRSTLPRWLTSGIATVASLLESGMPERVQPTASMTVAPAVHTDAAGTAKPAVPDAPPAAPRRLPAIPPISTDYVPPRQAAAIPPPASPPADDGEQSSAAPLPPPIIDPADPYQKRAEAVGLHPGLSHVLLARLSPTDYRNAGIAIERALAETPDNAVFAWPRQRQPELAAFQVRFVPGAAPGCRRYVVTVTKDGWLTTAPPMERCGPQRHRPQRG